MVNEWKHPASFCCAQGQRPCILYLEPKGTQQTPRKALLGCTWDCGMLIHCFKMPCALRLGIFAGDSTCFGKHCSALGRKTRIWEGSNCCDRPRKSSAWLCWVRALLLASLGRDFTLWKCFRSTECCPSQRADRAGLHFPPAPHARVIFTPAKVFPSYFSNLHYQHKLLSLLSLRCKNHPILSG